MRQILTLMLLVGCFFVQGEANGERSVRKFIHPGVVVDQKQLSYIRSQLDHEPFSTAFHKALKSRVGLKTYKPKGPPSSGVIECGAYSKPNNGCSDEDSDASAAVLQLLLFALTNETIYAKNAVAILDEYGTRLKGYNNTNAPLQAAWGASKWGRAAELANHLPYVGWSQTSATSFGKMLRNVALPLIHDGSHANGNWELSMISGMIGIAVFLDDEVLFDHAVAFWRQRIPAYFYSYPLDGNTHKDCPRGEHQWYGQTVFNASTNGHCQETCRDEGHTEYGVAEATNAAETAFIQGVDLYAEQQHRLPAAFEYNAMWALGKFKVPPYVCGGKVKASHDPTYEIAYNAYVNRGNVSKMPNTLQYLIAATRKSADPVDVHMMVYETLTHGGCPPQGATSPVSAPR
jgi:hypothetical protein